MLGGGGWLGGFKSHAVPSFPQSLVLLFLLINLKEPVFMKLCLSSSSTSLMCNAHVVRHVNNAPHRVILPLLCFTSISSNRWTPMFVNGGFMASFWTEAGHALKVPSSLHFYVCRRNNCVRSFLLVILIWLPNPSSWVLKVRTLSPYSRDYVCSLQWAKWCGDGWVRWFGVCCHMVLRRVRRPGIHNSRTKQSFLNQ